MQAALERYVEDGVVCLRSVFDAHWLDIVGRAIDEGRANPGPFYVDYSAETRPRTYETDFWVWPENRWMREFIFDSPAAALVGRIMDTNSVMLVTDNWLVREAGAVNRAPWHHDGPYFDLDGRWCVLWMGLEPIVADEGVVFLKGSHRWGRRFMPLSFTGSGPKADLVYPYEPTPEFGAELDRHEVLAFDLEPGDCLVFDAWTVHGAPDSRPAPNTVRRLTMRFADGEAVYSPRGPWTLEMTDYLEARYGLVPGGSLACDLLPVLWRNPRTVGAA